MKCGRCLTENPPGTSYCGRCGTKLESGIGAGAAFTRTIGTAAGEWGRGHVVAGRFEIIEKVGQGGMGSVFRAHDAKIDEEIALKRLAPEIAADAKATERFKNELKLARRIVHRNVGRVFELHEAEGFSFITMEFVPGEDLKSLLRRAGRLSPERAAELGAQIADGLAEAHRLGVIHRDLKPHNILLDREGRPRIMDFGIARLQGGTELTDPGALIGTPDYMTPEQAEGRPADARSDIYSLGVILFEMLTGRVPFQGESALSVLHQHKTARPADPRSINPLIPPSLDAAVLRCLEKEPAARFQTAEELKKALDDVAGVLAPSPTGPKKTGEVSRPSAVRPPTAERSPIRSIAVLPFKDLSPQRDQDYFCEGLAEELINALTRVEDLRVAARTSSFSFKGKDEDVRGIGAALNVGAVLEGSVQKSGSRLRITAQLVDVADGYHLWSEKFDRSMKDIFAVQDEISMAIVEKLKVGLREGEKEKLVKKHTRDKDAYNLYLKGRYYWNRRYRGDMIKAVDFFGRAVRRDPEYALPYVGIADVFNIFGQWAFIHPRDAYLRAKAALQKALEIDDSLSEIYSSLGFMAQSYEADLPAAEAHYRRSLELNPRNAYAHGWFSLALGVMDRPAEALAEIERAIQLDPMLNLFVSLKGVILGLSGRAEEGRTQIQKAVNMDPGQPMPYLFMGAVAILRPARLDLAVEYLEKAAGFGLTFALGWLGMAYALTGRVDDARKTLERLGAIEREWFIPPLKRLLLVFKPGLKPFRGLGRKYVAPLLKSLILIGLDRRDEAFAELEKSSRNHDYFLPEFIWMGFSALPAAGELEADPRFKAVKGTIRLA